MHRDDYGIEPARIILSGTTWNKRLKEIRRNGAPELVGGETEIFMFLDMLKEYKTYMKQNLDKQVIMTDLSKTGIGYTNKYDVAVNTFTIKQNASKPFVYDYSVALTAIPIEYINGAPRKPLSVFEKIRGGLYDLREACGKARKFLDSIEQAAYGFFQGLSDAVQDCRKMAQECLDTVEKFNDLIVNTKKMLSESLAAIADDIFGIPQDVTGLFFTMTDSQINANTLLIESFVREKALETAGGGYWVPKSVLDKLDTDSAEFLLALRLLAGDIGDAANTVKVKSILLSACVTGNIESSVEVKPADGSGGAAQVIGQERPKSAVLYNQGAVPSTVPNRGGQDFSVRMPAAYGVIPYQVKGNDTWESLALMVYGDAAYAEDLTLFNGLGSLSDVTPGSSVNLPQFKQSGGNTENIVSYQRGFTGLYGRDIELDTGGPGAGRAAKAYIRLENNDFKTSKGVETLNQSLFLRLSDSVWHRVRRQFYGIRRNTGDGNAAVNYLVSSVYDTVAADGRVEKSYRRPLQRRRGRPVS
ncbi:MAG: hypothetical protein LBD55_05835 [Treponema sp.]|nr:hypothetical protein [Treponema sp.]